ncbi:MAG: sel1 repeat family protein [Holosporales bacterium]|nr:sel1 repeat family protein [Holosporales bacterium]
MNYNNIRYLIFPCILSGIFLSTGFSSQPKASATESHASPGATRSMAIDDLRKLALSGDAVGQAGYAERLISGCGVQENPSEAAKFFKLAADQGNELGLISYGMCLSEGLGVEKDVVESNKYLKLAADKGSVRGQVAYGISLASGIGVTKNETEAARYFKLAADQGDVFGCLCYNKLRPPTGRDQQG